MSKLTVPSRRSAALFAARLRIARSETPGWRILCWSPASFAGRLDLISDGERQFSRPARSRSRFPNNVYPWLHHRAILNRAAKNAALLSDDALFAGVNFGQACSRLRLYTMPVIIPNSSPVAQLIHSRQDVACYVFKRRIKQKAHPNGV